MTRVSLDLGDDGRMDITVEGDNLDEATISALREIGEGTLRKMREGGVEKTSTARVFSDDEYEEPRFVSTLSDHSLAEVRCDHETSRDKAFCNCGMWASEWEPSIGRAREAWARHVWEVLNA